VGILRLECSGAVSGPRSAAKQAKRVSSAVGTTPIVAPGLYRKHADQIPLTGMGATGRFAYFQTSE